MRDDLLARRDTLSQRGRSLTLGTLGLVYVMAQPKTELAVP